MRYLTWAVRLAVFLFLLAFAVKNTEPVTLRFYFDLVWQAPLVAVLLAFFTAGVALGLLAMLGTWFGQRREISRLQRNDPAAEGQQPPAATQPPAAEG